MVRKLVLCASLLALAAIGCLQSDPTPMESRNPLSGKSSPLELPTITATPTFTSSYAGLAERINGGDCGHTCDPDSFWIGTCESNVYLRHWNTSFCAMTTVFFDFATGDIPNSAVINEVKVCLNFEETKALYSLTQPPDQGCTPPGGDEGPDILAGLWYKGIPGAPGTSLVPNRTAPWICGGMCGDPSKFSGDVGPIEAVVTDCDTTINVFGTSRYLLDIENADPGNNLISWAINKNAEIKVKYSVPGFTPCLDGQTTIGTSCVSCSGASLSVVTNGNSAVINKHVPEDGICTQAQQMVLVFDTSDLHNSHDISTAQLTYNVETINSGINVDTKKISIYSRTSSTACGSYTISKDDFKGCGSLTLLGTTTITSTGSKTFTIPSPNSNVSKADRTVLVLVDDSTFTDPEGSSHEFSISTRNHGTSGQRPKLAFTYQ